MLNVGDQAPDFNVKAHTGDDVRLSDLEGRTVVLWFYPKADTPGCTAEGIGFRDRIQQYGDKDAEILGVSFDTVEENRAFAEKFNFPFRLLCDTKREIGMAYGACDDPTAQYAKRITYVIGPDGRIVQAIDQVNAREHPEALLCTL
ncbi:MAG TPA: peroxiredoxin [Blastocatellia bacterium]|nr:peroxiredoxin [Blastocatellia bacterium]